MSGKDTFTILEKIFKPKTKQEIDKIKGYTIKYGNIIENGEIQKTFIGVTSEKSIQDELDGLHDDLDDLELNRDRHNDW